MRNHMLFFIIVPVFAIVITLARLDHLGIDYLLNVQYPTLERMLDGTMPAPYQYRMLWALLAGEFVQFAGIIGGLALFHILAVAGMFVALYGYLRTLAATPPQCILALSIAFWVVIAAFNQSPYAYDNYLEITLYLVGMIAIQKRRDGWILPLTITGAFNRETIVFLPIIWLGVHYVENPAVRRLWIDRATTALALPSRVRVYLRHASRRGHAAAQPHEWQR